MNQEIIYHERKDINIYRENSRINLKELAIMLGVDEASVATRLLLWSRRMSSADITH